jgi:copper oxidase (laccase) domain-containing protein
MKTYKPVHNFASGVRVAFSSVIDESIAAGAGSEPLPRHTRAATDFLHKYGFNADERVTVFVTYSSKNTYAHVERVDENTVGSLRSDALFTTVPGKVITLPVADCVATVVYDPVAMMLGVLHLGRHSSVAGLIEEFAIRVADEVGSDPRNWHIWMSPSIQAENNALDYFEPPHPDKWKGYAEPEADGKIHIDIPGHNRNCFERLGVPQANISVSPIDTYMDKRYFSHRAATEGGHHERQGRMMVAAMLQA